MRAKGFRTDVQALRGLAVLSVLLYHLEISVFKSGFLGVDIFFVVSGYLMALTYSGGGAASFYKRRIVKLIPVYLVTIVMTIAVGIFVLHPVDYYRLLQQSISGVALIPNIGFWLKDDYFFLDAFNPLLHLWSMGVEFQFYLLVPLVVLAVRRSFHYVLIAAGISFGACLVFLQLSPKTSFFMMPLRLWEFLIGYIVAYLGLSSPSFSFSNSKIISWLSCFVIIASVCFSRIQPNSPSPFFGHPGFYSFLVCVSTAMILAVGLPWNAGKKSWVLVKLGDLSYPLYLAHYPIITFLLYDYESGTHGGATLEYLLVIPLLIVTVFFLNLIYRQDISLIAVTRYLLVGALGVGAISIICFYSLTESQRVALLVSDDRGVYRCGKTFRLFSPFSSICYLNEGGGGNVLLVGNSHADLIKEPLSDLLKKKLDLSTLFYAKNNPLMSEGELTPDDLVNDVAKHKVGIVIFHYSHSVVSAALLADVANKLYLNNVQVFVLGPVPYTGINVVRQFFMGGSAIRDLSRESYLFLQQEKQFVSDLKMLSPTARVFSLSEVFCEEGLCAVVDSSGVPIYFDDNHLTKGGVVRLVPSLNEMVLQIETETSFE